MSDVCWRWPRMNWAYWRRLLCTGPSATAFSKMDEIASFVSWSWLWDRIEGSIWENCSSIPDKPPSNACHKDSHCCINGNKMNLQNMNGVSFIRNLCEFCTSHWVTSLEMASFLESRAAMASIHLPFKISVCPRIRSRFDKSASVSTLLDRSLKLSNSCCWVCPRRGKNRIPQTYSYR